MFEPLQWGLVLLALASPAQMPRSEGSLPGAPPPGGPLLSGGRPIPGAPAVSWNPLSTAEQFGLLLRVKGVWKEIGIESPPEELLADLRQLAGVRGDQLAIREGKPPADPSEYLSVVEKHCGRSAAKRLREVRFQALGLRFAPKTDSELARALGLSSLQAAALDKLPVAGLPEQLGGSFGEALRTAELRFLTEAQRAKWEEACGTLSAVQLPPLVSVAGHGGKVRVPRLLAGGAYARILGHPAVQLDLLIAERQKEKLDALVATLQEGDAEALEGVPDRVDYEELARLAEQRRDVARKAIQEALGVDAEKRVSQVARQQAGLLPSLRSDPEVERLLGVTEEQHEKLAFLLQSGSLPSPPRVVGRPSPQLFGQFREYRRVIDEAIRDQVLTAPQRDIWKDLTGEVIDVDLKLLPFLPAAPPRVTGG